MKRDGGSFLKYLEMVARAEQAGNIRLAYKYLDKAEKIETSDTWFEYKKWVIDYGRAILGLLYDKNANISALCRKLIELHKSAKSPKAHIYSLVREMDMRLLVSVLQKQYKESTTFDGYEELALELIGIVEREGRYELDGEDLYTFAYSVLGNYYVRSGRIFLGEEYFRKVWNRLGEKNSLTKYEFCGLVNLGTILTFQGKIEVAAEVFDILWEKLLDGKVSDPYQGDVNRMVVESVHVLELAGKSDQAFSMLRDSMDSNLVCCSSWDDNILEVYSTYLLQMDKRGQEVSPEMLAKISHVLATYKMDIDNLLKAPWRQCNYYQTCYFLEKAKKNPHAVMYLDESVKVLVEGELPEGDRLVYFNCMAWAIKAYRELGQFSKVQKCAIHIMGKLLEFYSMAEYYKDNEELEAYLGVCKTGFYFGYLASMESTNAEKRFEYSMNYKNILCSVIRARNHCIDLQRREKRKDIFAYYTLGQLAERLPECTAVIEYLYVERETLDTGRLMPGVCSDTVMLEIFVLVKKKGIRILHHIVPENRKLSGEVSRFIGLVQSSGGKYLNAAKKIYGEIFEPFEKALEGVERLFISPDHELCNMPFEVLLDVVGKGSFCENIVYVQSLRDVFEVWDSGGETEGKACVIGNPAFQLNAHARDRGDDSNIRQVDDRVQPLPYSEYEARLVAEVLNGSCFIGKQATKYTVNTGYRYIHIATHGMLQAGQQNPWYESMLVFSGFVDFFYAGKQDMIYGDGALTAEEISKKELAGTELVVLSACNSGSSVFSRFEQQVGLHVAFGVAGVKYVVSALWEVDDFAAALMMSFFYNKIRENVEVSVAMQLAKQRLRGISVHDIRNILEQDENGLSGLGYSELCWLWELPEDYMPYHAPCYWGGFVCYQHKF